MKRLLTITGLVLFLSIAQAALANQPEAHETTELPETVIQTNETQKENTHDPIPEIPQYEAEEMSAKSSLSPSGGGGTTTRGVSPGCDTSSFTGVLWVPSGNVCYVQNGYYTYSQIWVQGTLVVGGTSSTTTLTANGGDILVYGSNAQLIVGYTTG